MTPWLFLFSPGDAAQILGDANHQTLMRLRATRLEDLSLDADGKLVTAEEFASKLIGRFNVPAGCKVRNWSMLPTGHVWLLVEVA